MYKHLTFYLNVLLNVCAWGKGKRERERERERERIY